MSFPPIGAVILISFLSYGSGLLQNDYFDLEEDRRDRPSRPLPANKVRPATVILVAALFVLTALAVAFLTGPATGMVTLCLSLLVTAYDYRGKRIPVVGPVLMGLCRGFNFLLGASVHGWNGIFALPVLASALFLTLYIAIVTHIAAGETEGYRAGPVRWAPGLSLVIWFSSLYLLVRPSSAFAFSASVVLAVLAGVWALFCGSLLTSDAPPPVVQQTIGRFLRDLLLIQATVAALAGYPGVIIVVMLLAAWPISQKLARRFYAS